MTKPSLRIIDWLAFPFLIFLNSLANALILYPYLEFYDKGTIPFSLKNICNIITFADLSGLCDTWRINLQILC